MMVAATGQLALVLLGRSFLGIRSRRLAAARVWPQRARLVQPAGFLEDIPLSVPTRAHASSSASARRHGLPSTCRLPEIWRTEDSASPAGETHFVCHPVARRYVYRRGVYPSPLKCRRTIRRRRNVILLATLPAMRMLLTSVRLCVWAYFAGFL